MLRQASDWVLDEKTFADLPMHADTNGKTTYLAALTVPTAWSVTQRKADAFDKATKLSQAMFSQVA